MKDIKQENESLILKTKKLSELSMKSQVENKILNPLSEQYF